MNSKGKPPIQSGVNIHERSSKPKQKGQNKALEVFTESQENFFKYISK